MFIKNILLYLVLLLPVISLAQNLPEQDCPGALPICDSLFTQRYSYKGPGLDKNELPSTTCLLNGKNNAVWYIFTTSGAGYLQMYLTPIDRTDDYDFAVYNLTGHTCADIKTGAAPEVRCNFTLNNANGVGDSTGFGFGGTGNSSGASGPAFNDSIVVTDTPQTFALLINDFTSGGSGYTLDFEGSTTSITDTVKPKVNAVDTSMCDSSTTIITLNFSRPVLCDSIYADGSQFSVTGPGGTPLTVVSAYDTNCSVAGTKFTSIIYVQVSTPITLKGNYTVSIHAANATIDSGHHIVDVCYHELDDTTVTFVQKPLLRFDPTFTYTFGAACQVDTVYYNYAITGNDSSFLWEFGDGTTSTDTIPPPHVYPDTGTYTVTLVEYSGICSNSSTQQVHVGSTFYAFLIAPDSVCAGKPVFFRDSIAGGNSTKYYYDFNGTFQPNPTGHDTTVIYTDPGIDTAYLIVTLSGDGPCPDTITKIIVVDSLASANFVINPQVVCQGTPITFTDASTGAPTAWLWNFGNGNSSVQQNVSHTYDSIGIFNLTFTVSNACDTSHTGTTLTVKKIPSFSLGPDTAICLPDSVLLVAYPDADSVMWSNGDTTPSIYFSAVPSDVHVRVVLNGCPFETSRNIGVQEDGCIAFNLPTAFSPNGDGKNDFFRLKNPERIQGVDIKVYNRWGEVVFHGTTINFQWDGTYNGENAPMDVYTWYAVVTGLSGQNEFEKGNITLVR